MSTAPIVFIHYGRSSYLHQTLSASLMSNPEKPVFLLGDESNRRLVPRGVQFVSYKSCEGGSDLVEFHRRFIPIAGTAHHFNKQGGTDTWLRFVFARWFLLRNFSKTHKLQEFWTFDSDTLICGKLSAREDALRCFDATEQCGGCCLNGFIHRPDVVQSYCEEIVEVFGNTDYLNSQRERLKQHSGLAFNEMDVWQHHRKRCSLNTLHIGKPRDGEAFDDALAIHSGWITAHQKVRERIPVKYLERDRDGGFFAFTENDQKPVRLITLNLSWLPQYVYRLLLSGCKPVDRSPYAACRTKSVDFSEPFGEKLSRNLATWIWKLRSRVSRKR